MKKIIIILIFCIGFILKLTTVFSQAHIQFGLYKVFLDHKYGLGYCYVAKDSTFIFFGTKEVSSENRNWNKDIILEDTLTRMGSGKWSVADSFFIFNFKASNAILLNDIKYSYTSYSQKPYDSLLVNVTINIENDTNGSDFLLVLPQIMKPFRKSIHLTLPLVKSDSALTIIRGNEGPWNFHLSPGNNFHNLTLTFPPHYKHITTHGNVNKIQLIENAKVFCKWYSDRNNFTSPFKKDQGGLNKLKDILYKNRSYFPKQIALYDMFILQVNKYLLHEK